MKNRKNLAYIHEELLHELLVINVLMFGLISFLIIGGSVAVGYMFTRI